MEKKQKPKWKKVIKKLHLWAGLVSCVPLVIIGITGSLLVYNIETPIITYLHTGLISRGFVGVMGVLMLGFAITGLIMWWPKPGRWKQSFFVPPGSRGLRLHKDLHKAVGIWGVAIFVTISFTGVYLVWPLWFPLDALGLHAGRGYGATWKMLVCISGLLPLFFSVTGISMWWLKKKAKKQ